MFILLHQEATIEQTLFILQKDTSFSGLFSPKCLRQFGLLLVGFSKRLDGCAMTRDLLLEFDPLDRKFDPKITACASFTCLQRGKILTN